MIFKKLKEIEYNRGYAKGLTDAAPKPDEKIDDSVQIIQVEIVDSDDEEWNNSDAAALNRFINHTDAGKKLKNKLNHTLYLESIAFEETPPFKQGVRSGLAIILDMLRYMSVIRKEDPKPEKEDYDEDEYEYLSAENTED